MELNATTEIRLPPHAVYEFVSDPAHDVQWRTGATESGMITELPLRVGSEGYVKAGDKIGRWKVVALEPGKSVDWEFTEGPYVGSGGYRLENVDGNTRFTLVADVQPKGMLRLMGPLFARIGRKQNMADVQRLKDLLEGDGDIPQAD